MAKAVQPDPVMVFVGILAAGEGLFDTAIELLRPALGEPGLASEVLDFTYTDYYAAEMGPGLKRKFVAFDRLEDPARLASIKTLTNDLECKLAAGASRPVNLDPGYITAAKLVLATAKNNAHRIYLGEGIYAEITLSWRKRSWRANTWTYPDYRSEAYQRFFTALRARYLETVGDH